MWVLAWAWMILPVFSEEKPFPVYLEGKSGFLYSLQMSPESRMLEGEDGIFYAYNPVLALDGSPLYIGRKNSKGPEIKISREQLYRERLLSFLPENPVEFRSERVEQAFEVRLYPGILQGILNSIQEHPEHLARLFENLGPSKTYLIQQLLFKDQFVLTAADLRELRQSDRRTLPPPIEFELLINSQLDLEELLRSQVNFPENSWVSRVLNELSDPASKAFDALWSMSIVIQVDKLVFHIREKRLVFDPKEQKLNIEIIADRAQVSGPLKEIGEAKRLINWRGHEEDYRLENGEIGPMALSFSLKFTRESPDFWRLYANPQLFSLKFAEEEPTVKLHVKGVSSQGQIRDDQAVVKMGNAQKVAVLNTLAPTMTQALTTRFFSDTVSLKTKKAPILPNAENISFQNWIREIRFVSDGVDLVFDSQFELAKLDECVPRPIESFSSIDFKYVAPQVDAKTEWGLIWTSENQHWEFFRKTGEPPSEKIESPAFIRLTHHPYFLNWVFYSAWLAGEFCIDSRLWASRPAYTPLMEVRLTKAPELIPAEAGNFYLNVEGDVRTWEREITDLEDKFSRLAIQKFFRVKVPLDRENLDIGWGEMELVFKNQPDLEDGENLNDSESDLVRRLVLHILERMEFLKRFQSSREDYPGFSLRKLAENLGQGVIRFDEFSWSENAWMTRLELQDFSPLFVQPEDRPEKKNSLPEMETKLVQKPDYWVADSIVDFVWDQASSNENEGGEEHRLFYSWTLYRPDQEESSREWSQFDIEKQVKLALKEEGLYRFEVRAMNRDFEIEFPSKAVHEFYFLGTQSPENFNSTPELKLKVDSEEEPQELEIQKDSDHSSQDQKPNRMSAKGAFGCGLKFTDEAAELNWFWLAGFLLVLALLRAGKGRQKKMRDCLQFFKLMCFMGSFQIYKLVCFTLFG